MKTAVDFKPAVEAIKARKSAIDNQCDSKADSIISATTSRKPNWVADIASMAGQIQTLLTEKDNLNQAIITLQNLAKPKTGTASIDCFQISSLSLANCWRYLISDKLHRERLHLVTGPIAPDGTKVLSKMETLKFKKQSPTFVLADPIQTMHRITTLDEKYGHLLLGMFHNHPGKGAHSTMPSGTDTNFMERYAKIGIHCLGGIFSMDGYVRFFNSGARPFSIQVYGKGWDLIQETKDYRVFKIREGF